MLETLCGDLRLRRRRFSVRDVQQMHRSGVLHGTCRVELIDGELIDMAPIGSRHAGIVNRLTRIVVKATLDQATVAVQNPVFLDSYNRPEADLALLVTRAGIMELWLVDIAAQTLTRYQEPSSECYRQCDTLSAKQLPALSPMVLPQRSIPLAGLLDQEPHP